jgi:ABC-type transport system involved in cytochrome c biogenesis permease subunit
MKKWICSLLVLACVLPAAAEKLSFDEASRLAIQAGGRKKPLDTFAAETLQLISGRRTVIDPESGRRLSSMDGLFSIWFGKREWESAPIVLVSNPDLRKELGLSATRTLYTFEALMALPRMAEFHFTISNKNSRKEDLTSLEREAEIVLGRLDMLNRLLSGEGINIVPSPDDATDRWTTPFLAGQMYDKQTAAAVLSHFKRMSTAYLLEQPAEFSIASAELREMLRRLAPEHYPASAAINREVHYNQLHPFRIAWIFYLASFFFLLPRRTYSFGIGLFSIGTALNIYGFILRGWIAERAPVTNMYETVVSLALGIAVFALIFEAIYRARVYAIAAAPLAVVALILADLLPSVLNPNINPLPPVLRDNFWLVTHVVTIMLGYAAFALALGLAHIILGWYLFKPATIDEKSELHFLNYRALQLGILFLAAGTILGGVWANYSWGRFWGWDPKETWALIALLLYIGAIHGKIAGWWGNFGLAVASAVCFNGILMAWYGVNFVLGAGLHSYGFGGGGVMWVTAVVLADLLFVGICIVARLKRSFGGASPAPARASASAPAKLGAVPTTNV